MVGNTIIEPVIHWNGHVSLIIFFFELIGSLVAVWQSVKKKLKPSNVMYCKLQDTTIVIPMFQYYPINGDGQVELILHLRFVYYDIIILHYLEQTKKLKKLRIRQWSYEPYLIVNIFQIICFFIILRFVKNYSY